MKLGPETSRLDSLEDVKGETSHCVYEFPQGYKVPGNLVVLYIITIDLSSTEPDQILV